MRLRGRRLIPAREVLRARPGATVKAGLLGGLRGRGEVIASSDEELLLKVVLDEPPPPRANVDLVLAMPLT